MSLMNAARTMTTVGAAAAAAAAAAARVRTGSAHVRTNARMLSSLNDKTALKDMEMIGEQLRGLGGGEVHIDVDSSPDVAVVRLSNPERRNALSGKMMAELGDAVRPGGVLATFSGSCLVLHGEGGTFCSGADLSVVRDHMKADDGHANAVAMSKFMQHTLTSLRRLPIMSCAAIEGYALGGGAELSTACDFRVVAEDARVRFVHVSMGASPGWGGGSRLTKLVGRSHALRLLGGSFSMDGFDAEAIRFADLSAAPGDAVSCAHDLMRSMFLHPTLPNNGAMAVKGMKSVVAVADDFDLDTSLQHEAGVFSSLWGSPPNVTAIEKSLNPPPKMKNPNKALPSTRAEKQEQRHQRKGKRERERIRRRRRIDEAGSPAERIVLEEVPIAGAPWTQK